MVATGEAGSTAISKSLVLTLDGVCINVVSEIIKPDILIYVRV